jgi:tetratricopeptide (TPR) repeat protein
MKIDEVFNLHFKAILKCTLGILIVFSSFTLALAQMSPEAQKAYDRGLVAADQQAWDLAITNFNDAQRLAGKEPRVLYSLGLAHAKKGDTLQAIGWWRAYLEMAPNDAKADAVRVQISSLKAQLRAQEQQVFAKAVQLAKTFDDGTTQGRNAAASALIPVILREIGAGDFDMARDTLSNLPKSSTIVTEEEAIVKREERAVVPGEKKHKRDIPPPPLSDDNDQSKSIPLYSERWYAMVNRDLETAIVLQRAHIVALQGDFDAARTLLSQLSVNDLAFAQYGYYTDTAGHPVVGDRYYDAASKQWSLESGNVKRYIYDVDGLCLGTPMDKQMSIFLARLSYELKLVDPQSACFITDADLGHQASEQSTSLTKIAAFFMSSPWPSSEWITNSGGWKLSAFTNGPYQIIPELQYAKCCGHDGPPLASQKCGEHIPEGDRWIDYAHHICDDNSFTGEACDTASSLRLLKSVSSSQASQDVPGTLSDLAYGIGLALLRYDILEGQINHRRASTMASPQKSVP